MEAGDNVSRVLAYIRYSETYFEMICDKHMIDDCIEKWNTGVEKIIHFYGALNHADANMFTVDVLNESIVSIEIRELNSL